MTLSNYKILITGGTGSFGKKFVQMTLNKFKPKKLVIFSRDEIKQWDMAKEFEKNKNVKFITGDVRDFQRLKNVLKGIDYVVHAAATKIVPTAEKNPSECIKTNVNGAINLINAAIENNIKKVVALSTDKACNPVNLYGASKLASDKLFVSSNSKDKSHATLFSVVRYGNVMGSRGSVIPFFYQESKKKIIPITDKRMTRFMISLEQCVEQVWSTFELMHGGEIFIKKIPSMNIMNIAASISSSSKIKYIGIRPGEKIHEKMISDDDSKYTYEYKKYFKIIPSYCDNIKLKKIIKGGKKVREGFEYSSDKNNLMTISDLKKWLKNNKSLLIN